jgi:hypothetical protein
MTGITHSLTKLSLSWKAANCATTQKIPRISWKAEVHYRVHKSPALVPILSHINPIHTIPFYLSYYPPTYVLVFLVVSFLLAFPLITFMHFLSPHSCYMPCASHPPWLDHSNYTWRRGLVDYIEFEDLLTATMKSTTFWDVTQCCLVKVY